MINDRNHYEGKNRWFVECEDGTSLPYDSIGMHRYIMTGLARGKVTINGFEVIADQENTYVFKDNQ